MIQIVQASAQFKKINQVIRYHENESRQQNFLHVSVVTATAQPPGVSEKILPKLIPIAHDRTPDEFYHERLNVGNIRLSAETGGKLVFETNSCVAPKVCYYAVMMASAA